MVNKDIFIVIDDYLSKLSDECLIRGFSKRTVSTYSFFVGEYLKMFSGVCFDENVRDSSLLVSKEKLKRYVLWQIKSINRSEETIRLSLSSISFFAKVILGVSVKVLDDLIVRPKRKKKLPKVLSYKEIKKMISVTNNIKHKLIIEILYSSGLRLDEVRNLKRENLNLREGLIMVRNGKGGKDRLTLVAKSLSDDLLEYLSKTSFSTKYLFEGREGKLSAKTIQKIVLNAGEKAKLGKRVHPHMLRHSFATHLLNNGIDIRIIQKLLGHSNLRTTQGYTYVSNTSFANIKNPLDRVV